MRQALHVLRREAGELTIGTTELHLNDAEITSDVGQFDAAVAAGRLQDAAGLYGGPFLDGIHLRGAPEFETWVDRERQRLDRSYHDALERLARAAAAAGDVGGACRWWHQLALADPFSGRVTQELIEALVEAGDREAAIRHGEAYARHVRDLEIDADPGVIARITALRYLEDGGAVTARRDTAMPPEPLRADPADRDTAQAPEMKKRRSRLRPVHPAVVLIGSSALAAVGWWASSTGAFTGARPARSSLDGEPLIAVLPIEVISSDRSEDQGFGDIMDIILHDELQRLPARFIDRRAMREFDGTTLLIPVIADRLGATHVVAATASIAGGIVRISPELYDRSGLRIPLAESAYVRPKTDVFTLQTEVARAIASAIEGVLLPSPSRAPLRTPSPEALTLYADGVRLFPAAGLRRNVPLDSAWTLLDRAAVALERATALDPDFAPAWATLAAVRHFRASSSSQAVADSLYPLSLDAAGRAIAISDTEWQAWAAAGWTYTRTWRIDSARWAYGKARSLNSNGIWAYLGHFYIAVDSIDQAVAAFRESYVRDPAALNRRAQLANYLACAGAYDEASDLADPEVLDTLGVNERSMRARILFRQGRYRESASEFEARLRPHETPAWLMPYAVLKAGDTARAAQLLSDRQAAAESARGYGSGGDFALEDYLARGDTAGLVAEIRSWVDQRAQRLQYVKCYEIYPDLMAIPEVREILVNANLPAGAPVLRR